MVEQPPLGVMPYNIWRDQCHNPSLAEWLDRYNAVNAAIARYREAGLEPDKFWIIEVIGRT